MGFNSSLKSELAFLAFWGSVSADLMAETEGHPNSPFPDFLLKMGPIFSRADVRAAQVSLLRLFSPPADVAAATCNLHLLMLQVKLVGGEAILNRVDFKLRRLQVSFE